jgi:transposase
MIMKKQKRYTPEFRAEAVKLVSEQGLSQETAAKRLAIPKGTLANWVAASKASTGPLAPGARSAAELAIENARLRKELAEARMEREILKKAAAYFARESLPGTRS